MPHNFIEPLSALIGRAVISRLTADRLGVLGDLAIESSNGSLAAIVVRNEGGNRLIPAGAIFSYGPDAVVVDDSLFPEDTGQLEISSDLALANSMIGGTKAVSESGKLLGHIAGLHLCLTVPASLAFEIRSSLFDKLLGHELFVVASDGCAISGESALVIVHDDLVKNASHSVRELAERLERTGSPEKLDVVIRTHHETHP
jgi:uncharacterized protein YrrD